MQYRKLVASGLNVSVIAFGAQQIGDHAYWGPDADADAAFPGYPVNAAPIPPARDPRLG